MTKGLVPRSGIDTDARWGFSHTKDRFLDTSCIWYVVLIFFFAVVPLSADFTTANDWFF